MRYGNFLFPESRDPARDGAVLDEVMEEVLLTERLGFDTIWLSEHHFDGNCAYVDPVSFAAAIATATRRIRIGFAVAQMSLHHPVRLAEQLALIDHLSKGRLIIGLGRGTAYNIYEYQGYGIDHAEAQARFEEAADILIRAWTSETAFTHHGRFWDLNIPLLRPRPLLAPPPLRDPRGLRRALAGRARRRRQAVPDERAEPADDPAPHRPLARSGPRPQHRRGSHVSGTRPKLGLAQHPRGRVRRPGPPHRLARLRGDAGTSRRHAPPGRSRAGCHLEPQRRPSPARTDPGHALIAGSPATVAAQLADIAETGVGGVILQFRLGPMRWEDARSSLTLFAEEVAPLLARERPADLGLAPAH